MQKLDEVATDLENDMEQNGWAGRTVTLKYKLDTYQGRRYGYLCGMHLMSCAVFTRAKSFDGWITKKEDLYTVRSLYIYLISTKYDVDRERVASSRVPSDSPTDWTESDEVEGSKSSISTF